MSNFDENVVTKLKRLEREIERLKTGSEKALPDGWIPVSSTWTYASATTITVPSGAASIYKVGQGIKLTQTTVKYFYIVGVADTVLTITGGSDYTLANAAISAISYTNTPDTAIGFPVWFAWSVTPTAGTGTFTSVSGSGEFMYVGKIIHFKGLVIITTNGTAGTYVKILLPVAAEAQFRESPSGEKIVTATGDFICGLHCSIFGTPANQLLIYKYDGTYPGEDARALIVNGFYEAA